MNMDESANGSLSVEFRHLVSLTSFPVVYLWYRNKRVFKNYAGRTVLLSSIHTHFPYTESLPLEPLYPIPYFIHSMK